MIQYVNKMYDRLWISLNVLKFLINETPLRTYSIYQCQRQVKKLQTICLTVAFGIMTLEALSGSAKKVNMFK
jgi:hypothetical protein